MAVGFTIRNDQGELIDSATTLLPGGGFRSDLLQHYLLPFFTAGGISVDPYDGASFSGDSLLALIAKLKEEILEILQKKESWPLNEDLIRNYYESGKSYHIDLLPPREESVDTMSRAIQFAEYAHANHLNLVFIGD